MITIKHTLRPNTYPELHIGAFLDLVIAVLIQGIDEKLPNGVTERIVLEISGFDQEQNIVSGRVLGVSVNYPDILVEGRTVWVPKDSICEIIAVK